MTAVPKPLTMNPNYRAMVRGTRELHRFIAAGREDSPEADAIRDATDGPWQALSEVERRRVRNLSEDLYSLSEDPPPAQPTTPEAQAKLLEAVEARQRGDWDRALDLLREWKASIDPAVLSYLRGSIWLDAGDPETAALFFRHAHELEPSNGSYHAMALSALDEADPAAALKDAELVLQEHETFSPAAVARAADIAFMSACRRSEMQANRLFEQLEPILKQTVVRMQQMSPEIDRGTRATLHSLLGFGYEFVGNAQAAMERYMSALQIDPDNDALYVARGMLQYGTSPLAIKDFETAIKLGTPLVWPYVMLAHDCLISGRFEESRRLCERALELGGSAAVMSEVSEWMAIAQSHLGFPRELVRASFENAIRLDPSNERARRNLAAFEDSDRSVNFELRTVAALRTAALAERRFEMAA